MANRPECPNCGEVSMVRKVSSIVAEGITVGNYQSFSPLQLQDKTYWIGGEKEIHTTSILVQKLAPPKKPEIQGNMERDVDREKFDSAVWKSVPITLISILPIAAIISLIWHVEFCSFDMSACGVAIPLAGMCVMPVSMLVFMIIDQAKSPTSSEVRRRKEEMNYQLARYNRAKAI